MTQEEKRIKIAEACGWSTGVDPDYPWVNPTTGKWTKPLNWRSLPDYLNDLNACAEMEKSLIGINQTLAYQDYLISIMKTWDACPFLIFAPAWAKAEAFGLTLGLWKEGE